MADIPWLTVLGVGEDGPDGLSAASRAALAGAQVVIGPPRHLALIADAGPDTGVDIGAERIEWPVPFAKGIALLEGLRGRRVVMLASGDPFWFGAGSVIARHFGPEEWRALPGVSTFALAAAHLGWPLEAITCLGLHAAPPTRLRPHLAAGAQLIVLMRDGAAVAELGSYLKGLGFGESPVAVLEALGGPRERITRTTAGMLARGDYGHPVAVAITCAGPGLALPRCSGIADDFFDHDGQITKRPVRALAMSALAPVPGEMLWDIGGGSGSVAIEWLLTHPSVRAICIEPREDRAQRIRANADRLGMDRLELIHGRAPEALPGLPPPQAVFIGGGLSDALLEHLHRNLPGGTRLVAHAVTLESEALLSQWQHRLGGDLLRIALSEVAPLGGRRGWKSAYPVVQWRVVL